jgi:hypothetical protein
MTEPVQKFCDGPGCARELPPSGGSTPRRWCSDACRKRAARAVQVEADLAVGGTGHVAESVNALVAGLGVEEGSLSATLGALARAVAVQVDQGQPGAVSQLRQVLEALDEAAKLSQRGDEWFSPFDIWCGLSSHGVRRKSEMGRALVAWMREHNMSMGKLGPFDRPWACPSCGFQADREGRRRDHLRGSDS